eukprot:1160325-Pelagomonas_calceolata.AAC.4
MLEAHESAATLFASELKIVGSSGNATTVGSMRLLPVQPRQQSRCMLPKTEFCFGWGCLPSCKAQKQVQAERAKGLHRNFLIQNRGRPNASFNHSPLLGIQKYKKQEQQAKCANLLFLILKSNNRMEHSLENDNAVPSAVQALQDAWHILVVEAPVVRSLSAVK